MKRLLCIIPVMDVGGAETFLMKLYRNFDRKKYQVDFLLNANRKGVYDKEIRELGGELHYVPQYSGRFGVIREVKRFNFVRKFVKSKGYQYVFLMTDYCKNELDLYAAKKGGAKHLILRSTNSHISNNSIKYRLIHKVSFYLFKDIPTVKIAPSRVAAEHMFGEKALRLHQVNYINNGIDLDLYSFDLQLRDKTREELNITDKIVIGHVGRFEQQKNHEFLIDIFSEIHKRNPNSVLLLVGVGSLQEDIKKKCKGYDLGKDVIFAGLRKDVPRYLNAMDIFVFPSFFEGMPNTVIEAQATGLPCLISDTITEEANVTNLVMYCSLSDSASEWAGRVFSMLRIERCNQADKMKKSGYDIDGVTKQFIHCVFNNEEL